MAHSTLEFGPYRLRTRPDRLLRGTETVALRPKSLSVLAYLARHPGRVVTKDELRQHVWSAAHVSDTALRVTVREIRLALEDTGKVPRYLETVPTRGYRFHGPPPAVDRPGRGDEGPVVGRQRELQGLLDRLRQADGGRRQLLFLAGEPGVGKTTLLRLFLDRVNRRDATRSAVGQCVMRYSAGEPYGPVLEALARLCRGRQGEELIDVLERHAPMWLAQLPGLVAGAERERLERRVQGATRERMVRELHHAVERWTAETTLVLVLEDLHWSDLATLELLAAIAQRPEPARLLVVGTYRPAEAVVQAPALRQVVRELRAKGLGEHLGLEPLRQGDVAAYVDARLDGPIAEEIAALLFRRSGGNALFLVNVFEHLLEAGAIHRRPGGWALDGSAAALGELPEGLLPFIRQRLDDLSAGEREILEAASVVGLEFAAVAVAAALEREAEGVAALLEAVAARGHLVAHSGVAEWPDSTLSEQYRFRHALYREGLYAAIPEARRAGVHRRVGERLHAAWGERAAALAPVLAVHFEQGRERDHARRFRRLAGERALGRHAYHEAVEHLHRALEALAQTPRRDRESAADTARRIRRELELRTLLAPALIATRGYTDPQVERTHLRAQELVERLAEPGQQLAVLFNLWSFHLVRGEHAESRDLAARMTELSAGLGDGELYLMARSARAQSAFFLGDLAASAAAARDVVKRYDPELHRDLALRYAQDDPGVVCLCHLALLARLRGDPDQAGERERQALELAGRLDHPYSEAMALCLTTLVRQLRRDVETVDRQAGALAALAADQGFEHWQALGHFFRGWAMAARGDGDRGIERMELGLATWRGMGAGLCVPYLLGVLAETELALGRPQAAASRVTEARALVERNDERWWQAELHRLEGEVLLGLGESSERAEACFRQALAVARRQQAASFEERAALSLSRLMG